MKNKNEDYSFALFLALLLLACLSSCARYSAQIRATCVSYTETGPHRYDMRLTKEKGGDTIRVLFGGNRPKIGANYSIKYNPGPDTCKVKAQIRRIK